MPKNDSDPSKRGGREGKPTVHKDKGRVRLCHTCGGQGQKDGKLCPACRGKGGSALPNL